MKYTLVLSGGGALGIAHVGVLSQIKDKPSEIIGTSMGAIIGACISIGLSTEEIYSMLNKFSNIFSWTKYSYNTNSLIDTKKIEEIFISIFKDKKIKDTQIPLKIVATNLLKGNSKVFTKSDDVYIKDALLASMAIPGIFNEKEIDGEVYVDGFLFDNLPVRFAKYNNIVALDVLGQESYKKELPQSKLKTTKIIEMVDKSMRLLICSQTEKNLELMKDKNIKLININTKEYKTFHFNKTKELYQIGIETKISD